jgi:cell division protein FtsZ
VSLNLTVVQPTHTDFTPRIAVFGVGGGGANAVDNMIAMDLQGVEFVVANTDAQQLALSHASRRIQLGPDLTQGLGAGAKPHIGRAAAEESREEISQHLDGLHMLFVAAGMGGGTGTGATPVVTRIARERDILTVGVVTRPFDFEGKRRARAADAGIEELLQFVDTLIIIPNQNLFQLATISVTWREAFKMADRVLYLAVRGVTDLLIAPGLVNLDFADIRAVMAEMGRAMVGTGEAVGSNRAIRSAEAAMRNPLLENASIAGARGLLINITGGDDLTLYEVDQAANCIREEVGDAADIIFGSTVDTSLSGRIRVSVVATGLGLANPTTRPAFPIDALETTEESQESLEPVPLQGAGPHFTLGPEHRIKLTVPPEVDDAGNLISRIEQLLPLVRRTAANLSANLSSNAFPDLSRDLTEYERAISGNHRMISWGIVFGLGVILENSAAAARRTIEDRLRPPLEDSAQSALESLLTLHGPLILATVDGRELQEQADRLRMTRQEQLAFKVDAELLASQLKGSADIVEPAAVDVIKGAAASIGTGRFAERGTVYGIGSIKNLAGILVSAAALAAIVPTGIAVGGTTGGLAGAGVAWLALESLKKSANFAKITTALGSHYDRISEFGEEHITETIVRVAPFRRFVLANETSLRRIATNTSQLNWIIPYIDFISRTSE